MAAGRDHADAGQDLAFAIGPALGAPVADELQFRLDIGGDQPRVVAQGDLPFGPLRDDPSARKGLRTVGSEQPAGMIEMQVAQRHDVQACRLEPGDLEGGGDPRSLVATLRSGLVIEPFADPGFDETAPGRRLDQQAVERLEDPALVVDLIADEPVPQDPGHRPEQRPGVGPERAGLDEGDPHAATEIARPVDRFVHRHRLTCATSPRSRVPRRSRDGTPTPSAPTGPGISSRARASHTADRPGSTS